MYLLMIFDGFQRILGATFKIFQHAGTEINTVVTLPENFSKKLF